MSADGKHDYALVIGGAGFIGTNVSKRLLANGESVLIYDNLSRPGVRRNLRWLMDANPGKVMHAEQDVRDLPALQQAMKGATKVFHFAAQVAVTTSLSDPVLDFEINARGTLNVLEAIRRSGRVIPLLFTSTNKVYGHLEDISLACGSDRYFPAEAAASQGVAENRPVEFHSPYGCSKGAADQYVLDYAKTFGLHAVVFRMSCIYGLHQHGNEDQGWIAHFLLKALRGEAITIYGDGRQVRDALFVDDLVDAMMLAHERMGDLSGRAFNIGGGAANTISLLELLELIQKLRGSRILVSFDGWRRADQRYYVSDINRFSSLTGWSPKIGVREGVERLYGWLLDHLDAAGSNGTVQPKNASKIAGGRHVA
jgi:CDP-paratose 2-epimerase